MNLRKWLLAAVTALVPLAAQAQQTPTGTPITIQSLASKVVTDIQASSFAGVNLSAGSLAPSDTGTLDTIANSIAGRLLKSANLSDLTNPATARVNLGLGALAQLGVGSGLTSVGGNLSANVTTVAGRTGAVTLGTGDVSGLGPLSTLSAGSGLTSSGGALSVTYGTASGTAAQGNDSRITGALQSSGGTLAGPLHMGGNLIDGSNFTITGGTITGTDSSGANVTPTGAPTGLTLAGLAAQQGVLLDAFKQAGDADDTASFTRAVAAQVPILCGPKTYHVHDFSTGAVANFVLRGIKGCVIQRNSAANPSGSFFAIGAANVVIDGVTFDMNSGSVSANQWGVLANAGGQIINISNSVFKNNSGTIGACLTVTSTGPTAGGSFDISDNEVTNCTLQALYVSSASNGRVSGNWVHDVSGFGIFVGGTASQPSTDILLSSNRVFRSGSTGISVGGIAAPFTFGSPTAIRVNAVNNILQDNPAYGISLEGDYCDAIGNDISQSLSSVTVLGAIDTLERYGKIQNNTVVFAGVNFGIDIGGSQGMLVEGNRVTMNQGAAYNTGGNLNTTVRGNVATLTGTAIGLTNYQVEGTGSGATFPTQSSNTTIEGNTFNMTGSTTGGINIFDDAGGAPGASPNTVRYNAFNVTGSGTSPVQAVQWKGGPHSLAIDGNVWNGTRFVFSDPLGNGDVLFDWVNFGGLVQGVSSTTDIRSILPRDIETYGAGGSVLWVMPSNGGANYVQSTTTLSFSGTGCAGQAGTAQVNSGVIVGVKMTNVGSGCSGAVTVTASDTGGGSGATFTVGTVPVMPDGGTLQYLSATTHALRKSGGFVSLLPQNPIQLLVNNGPVNLVGNYGGTFWSVAGFNIATFAVASLPACGANNNGAYAYVTGSSTSKWQARCNGTNWLWPDGTTVSG